MLSPLAEHLRDKILKRGPLPISLVMQMALQDPKLGYYSTQAALGRSGDFITAPDISSLFGQAVGRWIEAQWHAMGKPDPCSLVELGPGRGIMIKDALSVLSADCAAALRLVLCDISPELKAEQSKRLGPADPTWIAHWGQIPEGAKIVVSNEFLDALPAEQIVKHLGAWHIRTLDVQDGDLTFSLGAAYKGWLPKALEQAPDSALVEVPFEAAGLLDFLARDFREAPGAALAIDYGDALLGSGDTLQALKAHIKVPVIETLGQADLTCRVNFAWLMGLAQQYNQISSEIETQAEFMAIWAKQPDLTDLEGQHAWHRLTSEESMGSLFKAWTLKART